MIARGMFYHYGGICLKRKHKKRHMHTTVCKWGQRGILGGYKRVLKRNCLFIISQTVQPDQIDGWKCDCLLKASRVFETARNDCIVTCREWKLANDFVMKNS